jgi:hypothetical protein
VEEDPVSFDHMLLWLSAKGQGSWSQFRAAVEELDTQQGELKLDAEDSSSMVIASDLPIYQQVRFAFERLGHVEFYSAGAENGWRIVPPSVAMRSRGSTEGVLCGARSPALLERLFANKDLTVEALQIGGMPQRIVVRSASQYLLVARARESIHDARNAAALDATPSDSPARKPSFRQNERFRRGAGRPAHQLVEHELSCSTMSMGKPSFSISVSPRETSICSTISGQSSEPTRS